MAALATLAVVWLGTGKPEGKAKAALDAWAATRNFTTEPARAEPDDGGEAARAVAELCEQKLEQARDQLNAGDDGAARSSLASLEQTLRDHPELLQGSWLMAERYRVEAQLAARAGESSAAWQERADVLEGERATAFGEVRRGAPSTAPGGVSVDIVVHGSRGHETYWDGARTTDRFSTSRGEHHLAILRGKRVAWSGWVSALLATKLDVWIADAPPCSAEDLAGAALAETNAVRVPDGIRCGAWAIAGLGPTRGTLRAAFCAGATCEPTSTWAYEIFATPATDEKKGFPAWATWTIAGVGVAVAASVILLQTGVFDREPTKRVVYDGSGL